MQTEYYYPKLILISTKLIDFLQLVCCQSAAHQASGFRKLYVYSVITHVHFFLSLRYRFKEYAIPWYMNRKYKRKFFFTPKFVQTHIR